MKVAINISHNDKFEQQLCIMMILLH